MNSDRFIEVPRTVGCSQLSLLLRPFQLYEGIIIIKWEKAESWNSAAMGVRFMDDYSAFLSPYEDTDTFKIFTESLNNDKSRKKFTINFTSNVVEYALAALTGTNRGAEIQEMPEESLAHNEEFAVKYLNDASSFMLCELIGKLKNFELDATEFLDEFSNKTIRKHFSASFEVNILKRFKSKYMSQSQNRGDNLALEAVTLASKLPVYAGKKSKQDQAFELLSKIRFYEKEIRRFSANKNALQVCNIIDDYINKII